MTAVRRYRLASLALLLAATVCGLWAGFRASLATDTGGLLALGGTFLCAGLAWLARDREWRAALAVERAQIAALVGVLGAGEGRR